MKFIGRGEGCRSIGSPVASSIGRARALFHALVLPGWKSGFRAGLMLDSGQEKVQNRAPKAGRRPDFDVFQIGLLSKSGRDGVVDA